MFLETCLLLWIFSGRRTERDHRLVPPLVEMKPFGYRTVLCTLLYSILHSGREIPPHTEERR